MKSLKYALLSALLCTLTFTATVYVSCKKDPCKGVACLNGGACNEGKCICPTGYTGTYCETSPPPPPTPPTPPPPPDPCMSVTCQNGGTCSNGVCSCPAGYEGTLCETESRARFIKTWSATDVVGSTTLPYTVAITKPATGAVVQITIGSSFSDNFFVNSVSATVSGSTMTIAKQNPDGDKYSVTGSGTIGSDGKLIVTYTLKNDDNGATQVYNGTWQ